MKLMCHLGDITILQVRMILNKYLLYNTSPFQQIRMISKKMCHLGEVTILEDRNEMKENV